MPFCFCVLFYIVIILGLDGSYNMLKNNRMFTGEVQLIHTLIHVYWLSNSFPMALSGRKKEMSHAKDVKHVDSLLH